MSRASQTEALILRASRMGEYHKQLLLLTPDSGVVKAVAFGAFKGKSRLVSASDPYSYARLHLYRNPIRDQFKITDIEVLQSFEGLRSNLGRSFAAVLLTELTTASYAGGGPDYRYPFGLLKRSLGLLAQADTEQCERIVFQYLLRFLTFAGFLHPCEECGQCGRRIERSEEVFFSLREADLVCGGCADDGSLGLSPGVRRYIDSALTLPLSRALGIGLDLRARSALIRLLRELLGTTMQTPLRSFEAYFSAGSV
jgi:DNA repair protein RecO (recombination protein O)